MLSGQEERAFTEIAEQIAADDPRFATSLRHLQARRPGRAHDAVIVVAAASAVLCLLLSLALPTLTVAALAFATYHCRPPRPARRRRRSRR